MSVSRTGKVKILGGHFAFLADDDGGPDCFVSKSVIERAGIVLAKGDAVTYTFEPNSRGPRAVSIALAN
jgi:cold shock CspA family protein